jgi:medium-chain acyl-[acyl-carrier-protein] hydrolase
VGPAGSYKRLRGGRVGLLELRTGSAGQPQLLCFAHAGGSPRSFQRLAEHLPRSWSVRAVEPPGRLATAGSSPTRVEALVEEYLQALPPELLEGVMLGHSLGGYVALALCQRAPRARGLVIAATAPPGGPSQLTPLAGLPDHQLVRALRGLGLARQGPGIAGGLSDDVLRLFLPALRADLTAFASFRAPSTLVRLPTLLCGGRGDPICSERRFADWQHLLPEAELTFAGRGHFFVQDDPEPLAHALTGFVSRLAAPDARAPATALRALDG